MSINSRRAALLARLPLRYATALRLRNAGIDDETIAECIEVDPEAVPTLMEVAEAKFAAAERDNRSE